MKHNWEYKKLGEVATYVNGYAFKPEEWKEEGLPIIRIQNLNDSDAPFNYYDGMIPSKFIVDNGDLLISWSASLGVYEWNRGRAVLNQHIFKVVFDKSDINKYFLKYAVFGQLENMAKNVHGATMKHIVKKDFDGTIIPVPPLPTQQRIVAELDCISGILEKKRQQLKELDNLAQAIFYDMFGDPVENDKGWEVRKLGEIGTLARGVSKHRPRNAPELLGGEMPLIQTGDVANSGMYITDYNSTYSEIGVAQSKVWQPGTLCITIAATIGKCSILTFAACFPDSVVGFIPNPNETTKEYVYYIFGCLQSILEEDAPAVAQKNINLSILNEINVPLPPLSLQQQFAKKIEAIERQEALINQSIKEVQTLFDCRMEEYFN